MIVRLIGKLIEKKEQAVVMNIGGLCYEVATPASVLKRIEDTADEDGNIHLVAYHYFQMTQSSGMPVLIGFINEIERDFFTQFIKVSGIGPKAAVRAFHQSISEIAEAIDRGDFAYLKTLPGIGAQRAKEIIAKLQGKVGRFGLIQDKTADVQPPPVLEGDSQQEALNVLLQLQYKKPEAVEMIRKAMERNKDIRSSEELLNEIYKQKVSR